MTKLLKQSLKLAALSVALALPSASAYAAGNTIDIPREPWSFAGPFGQFDRAQLQRGFQVYQNVCASCHSINRLRFRNLAEEGGPQFDEKAVENLAKTWPNEVTDGPNDEGEMYTRPARLSDPIPGSYANDKQARAAHNGALPPDLSLMAKARTTEYTGSVWYHPIHMLKDIVTAYQEGGPDYIHALLTGYKDKAPAYTRDEKGLLHPVKDADVGSQTVERCASVTHNLSEGKDVCQPLQDGMNYNAYFPGHQIAMMKPLSDGLLEYTKGKDGKPVVPETADQYARDVSAFLAWAADPSHDQRKQSGWLVMLYLLILTGLLYLAKKAIWKGVKH